MTQPSSSTCSRSTGDKTKIIGQYKVLSKIGSGSFATVWKAIHMQSGILVAIKAINREKLRSRTNGLQRFDSEINVMMSMRHENIVKLLGIHRSHRHIYLIIEYCDQDLFAYIRDLGRPLSESESARFLHGLLSGLEFLHNRNLAHRDLKPQNLLLTNSGVDLKIADFGFARDTGSESMAETMCGSPLYMAPEILRSDSYDAKLADLWSVGAILFEMVTGNPPYNARNTVELLQKIESSEIQVPSWLSPNCRSIIKGLLCRDVTCRLSLIETRSHPFLNSNVIMINPLISAQPSNSPRRDRRDVCTSSVEDLSQSNIIQIVDVISELADDLHDRPEISLALYTRCIQIMVDIRLKGSQGSIPISASFDKWAAQRVDQIAVLCRRLMSANCTSMPTDDTEINVEQFLYEKSLKICREAAVGELMGESAGQTRSQLQKATVLLEEVMKSASDAADRMAIQALLRGIKIRVLSLVAKSSSVDGSRRSRKL